MFNNVWEGLLRAGKEHISQFFSKTFWPSSYKEIYWEIEYNAQVL